jgi:hypothetical protein
LSCLRSYLSSSHEYFSLKQPLRRGFLEMIAHSMFFLLLIFLHCLTNYYYDAFLALVLFSMRMRILFLPFLSLVCIVIIWCVNGESIVQGGGFLNLKKILFCKKKEIIRIRSKITVDLLIKKSVFYHSIYHFNLLAS